MKETTDRIRTFIADEVLFEDPSKASELSEDAPLLTLLDSLGLTQLVAFLETSFSIEIDDAEITADNFRSIGDVARLVSSKTP